MAALFFFTLFTIIFIWNIEQNDSSTIHTIDDGRKNERNEPSTNTRYEYAISSVCNCLKHNNNHMMNMKEECHEYESEYSITLGCVNDVIHATYKHNDDVIRCMLVCCKCIAISLVRERDK